MKRKIFLVVSVMIIVLISFVIYNQTRFKEEGIVLKFHDIKEVEYGLDFKVEELIKACSGEIIYQEVPDTKKIGKQVLKFVVKENDVSKEFEYEIEVKDTKAPLISLKKEKDTINLNDQFIVSKYIQSVTDEIDGDLKYIEKPKESDCHYYTVQGEVNVQKEDTYKVLIVAIDKNDNETKKELSITVIKPKDKTPDVSKPSQNSSTTQYTYHPNNKVIVIDPGHQGKGNNEKEAIGPNSSTMKAKVTSGTTGVYSKKAESQMTLEVGLKLRSELQARGYTVVMTRTSQNVNISNQERAKIGNSHHAFAVIHLHCDGATSSARGAHTIAPSKNNPYCSSIYKASSLLARNVIDAYCQTTGIKSRGVSYRDDLTGLNWSEVPAIYLEMGFISNKAEDQLLSDPSFQDKCVKGIANGIDQYIYNSK